MSRAPSTNKAREAYQRITELQATKPDASLASLFAETGVSSNLYYAGRKAIAGVHKASPTALAAKVKPETTTSKGVQAYVTAGKAKSAFMMAVFGSPSQIADIIKSM